MNSFNLEKGRKRLMKSSSFSNPNSCESTSGASNGGREKKKKGGCTVKLSTDPQSVAARQRRHRISDRFKILQSLVPGGSKMDTVSMLEEAIEYVKFLKTQIWLHQAMISLFDNADDPSLIFPPNNFSVLPLNHQPLELYYSYPGGQVVAQTHLGLPYPWTFTGGEESGPFDTSMLN